MLYEAIIMGVLFAWIMGGRLAHLARIKFDNVWLIFLSFGIQFCMDLLGTREHKFVYDYQIWWHGFSYVLLFYFLWEHRKIKGIKILALGIILNFIVIMANGGTMPATITGLEPEMVNLLQNGEIPAYSMVSEHTRLAWLGDVMIQPWPKVKAFSVGDIFISLGAFLLVFKGMMDSGNPVKFTSLRELG